MIKELIGYVKAWIKGEEAELHVDKTWSFGWWEIIPLVAIVGLIIYWICR
ncbi:hypothetical protein PBAL39_17071 [Pedobacter sp. BAL39]|nr:hypothetical protein [Pedobacter sp. BAL39]EDM35214.1 hypothetical protein PBAL39_17071 [Pedobacter sp. BAL39]